MSYSYARGIEKVIKSCLTDDLLKKGWSGHCYLFAETFYHLYGKDQGWKVMCHNAEGFETHWWIQAPDGAIFECLDDEEPFPYYLGRGKGFLTREPSKRCQKVIKRYQDKLNEGIGAQAVWKLMHKGEDNGCF